MCDGGEQRDNMILNFRINKWDLKKVEKTGSTTTSMSSVIQGLEFVNTFLKYKWVRLCLQGRMGDDIKSCAKKNISRFK